MKLLLWALVAGWIGFCLLVVGRCLAVARRRRDGWARDADPLDCEACGDPLPPRYMAVKAHEHWFCRRECVPSAWRSPRSAFAGKVDPPWSFPF